MGERRFIIFLPKGLKNVRYSLVKTKKKIFIKTPWGKGGGKTCHVERRNAKLETFDASDAKGFHLAWMEVKRVKSSRKAETPLEKSQGNAKQENVEDRGHGMGWGGEKKGETAPKPAFRQKKKLRRLSRAQPGVKSPVNLEVTRPSSSRA